MRPGEECAELWLEAAAALESELETANAALAAAKAEVERLNKSKHDMDFCRSLLCVPKDWTLQESIIELQVKAVNARDAISLFKANQSYPQGSNGRMDALIALDKAEKELSKLNTGDYIHRDSIKPQMELMKDCLIALKNLASYSSVSGVNCFRLLSRATELGIGEEKV